MPINCSYCGVANHTIRTCNSSIIPIYYQRLQIMYTEYVLRHIDENTAKRHFINNIDRRFNAKDLRVIAVKYTNALASCTKETACKLLWLHFKDNILIHNIEEPNNPMNTNTQESEIYWFIDRSPQPPNSSPTTINTNVLSNLINQQIHHYVPQSDEYIPFHNNYYNFYTNQPFSNMHLPMDTLSMNSNPPIKKYPIHLLYLCSESDNQLAENNDCAICYETTTLLNSCTFNCNHKFCGTCIKNILTLHNCKQSNLPTCALCREPITSIIIKNPDIYNNITPHCY